MGSGLASWTCTCAPFGLRKLQSVLEWRRFRQRGAKGERRLRLGPISLRRWKWKDLLCFEEKLLSACYLHSKPFHVDTRPLLPARAHFFPKHFKEIPFGDDLKLLKRRFHEPPRRVFAGRSSRGATLTQDEQPNP